MGSLHLCCLLLTLASPIASAPFRAAEFDARGYLEQLGSGSATEREAAGRWLGLNLTLADYPTLAAGIGNDDPEMGRRLAMALASETRHLDLVLLLAEEDSSTLSSIGDSAFEDLLTRWCPKGGQRPGPIRAVERALEDHMTGALIYDGGTESLQLHMDRIARNANLGVPLVVDPSVASRVIDTTRSQGNGLTLMQDLIQKERLTYAGFGDWEGDSPGTGAWILVAEMGVARSRSGAQRLLAWFRAVQEDTPRAAHAARALGQCGWPAALDWLDRRWTERKDPNALAGLLAAASRGRASREMLRSGTRKDLLALADGALANSGILVANTGNASRAKVDRRSAEEIARALIGAGGAGLDGEELSAHWIADWPGLNDAQRWLRFALLEGQRNGGPAVRAFLVREVQGAGKLSDGTRFQALRALAAMPARERSGVDLGDVQSLVSWALLRGLGSELARLMHSLGVPVRKLKLPADWSSRMFRLSLACAQRDLEVAVGECLQIGESAAEPTLRAFESQLEELRFVCGPRWLRGVAESALKAASHLPFDRQARLERAFLVAGVFANPVDNEAWLRTASAASISVADFDRIGAWAGRPSGDKEARFLVRAVGNPPSRANQRAALVKAVTRAHRRLQESHNDSLAERFRESVWLASGNPDSPLHTAFDPTTWPGLDASMAIDLIALERLAP